MPATNFMWSLQDPSAVYHTLGMKRKCPESEVPMSKRACTNPEVDRRFCDVTMAMPESNMQCDGDNERVSMDTEFDTQAKENRVPELHPKFPEQVTLSARNCTGDSLIFTNNDLTHLGASQGMEDDNNNNNNNNSLGASSQICCQNSMIMDLHDECYSTAILPQNVLTDAEYEAACNMVSAMESEGAPDPAQYRQSYSNSSIISQVQSSPSMTNTSRLSTNSLSPDTKPYYVSDYY